MSEERTAYSVTVSSRSYDVCSPIPPLFCSHCLARVDRVTVVNPADFVCDACLVKLARAGLLAGQLRFNPPESGYQVQAMLRQLDELLGLVPPSSEPTERVVGEHGEVLSTGWVDGAFQPGHATLSCPSCGQIVTALVQVNGVAPGVCTQCFRKISTGRVMKE